MSIIDLLKDIPLSAVLKEKIITLETENESLRAENGSLKVQLSESEEKRRALDEKITHIYSLKFDEQTGTYIDANSPLRYCAVCHDAHNRKTPLRNDESGWYCQICKQHFRDPSRPLQKFTLGRPLA